MKSKAASIHTFQGFVAMLLKRGGRDPFAEEWGPFSGSLYADQLDAWFDRFSPSSFLVVPMKALTDPRPLAESVLAFLLSRLHLPPPTRDVEASPCLDQRIIATRCNARDDASRDGLDRTTRQAFRNLLRDRVSATRVAAVLAARNGSHLFGYAGDPGDVARVAAWLASAW